MRLIDGDSMERLSQVQLYLRAAEARRFVAELEKLLADPEASEHFHVFSEDGGDEVSVSILTPAKLAGKGYTPDERKAFGKWKPHG